MGKRVGLSVGFLLVVLVALWAANRSTSSTSGPAELPSPATAQQQPETRSQPVQSQDETEAAPGQAVIPPAATATSSSDAIADKSASDLAPEQAETSTEPESWDGDWLTKRAMDKPNMAALSPSDPAYDAMIEARQQFHPFEMELQALQPLEPNGYREALGRHKKGNAVALRRVVELQRAGHSDAAATLYKEWSRLFDLYRRRAYRDQASGPPAPAQAPR